MTFWRGIVLIACLEIAALAYWQPQWSPTYAPDVPSTAPVTLPPPPPALTATEEICQHWQYPAGNFPTETRRICVSRPVASPF